MTAAVRSELLKVRTTRSWWVYLIVIVLLAGLAAAATIGSAREFERSTVEWQVTLAESMGFAVVIAMILGITAITGEFRHGTITPTFLAVPVRERVLAAKAIAVSLLALLFALLALATVAAVSAVWLSLVDVDLHATDPDVLARVGHGFVLTLLWALLGLAIGTVVHGQVAAIVGTLVWIFVVEQLLTGLVILLDVEGVRRYLPFQALDAADGARGFAVSVAYVVGIGALGVVRTARRDIT